MTLPDIDPENISWIGYLNIEDQGPYEVDPFGATEYLDGYEEYENGIEGVKLYQWDDTDRKAREFHCRVKDDGWVTVWLDKRDDNYQDIVSDSNDEGDSWNPADVMDWTDADIEEGLRRVFRDISDEVVDDYSVDPEEIGLYRYEYPDANKYTLIEASTSQWEFAAADDTELYEAVVAIHSLRDGPSYFFEDGDDWDDDDDGFELALENTFGFVELVSENMFEPGDYVRVDQADSSDDAGAVILWS